METNFYIGQEVVAIRDHSKGIFKKGDEFIVLAIDKTCCNIRLDIGIKTNYKFMKCVVCNNVQENKNFFSSTSFAPKQYLSETTYEDIQQWIKKTEKSII